MPTTAQTLDRVGAGAVLDCHVSREGLAGVEARRECLGVVIRGVDRVLQVETVVDVGEEDVERPLILLIASGRADREVRLPAAGG